MSKQQAAQTRREGIRPNTFPTPNEHVDYAMEMLTSDEYKVLNFAIRHTWGWHVDQKAMALTMFTHGYGSYSGVGLSRATVVKCLSELSKYKFLIPVGKADSAGQVWSVGLEPDLDGLQERFEGKKRQRDSIMSPLRDKKKSKLKTAVYDTDRSIIQTDSGLYDRPTAVYGVDAIKDTPKDTSKDRKETTLSAVADAIYAPSDTDDWDILDQAASHTHTPPLNAQSEIPAQAEKVKRPMSAATSPSPLKQTTNAKSTETTASPSPTGGGPLPLISAEIATPTTIASSEAAIDGSKAGVKPESPAQAAQRVKVESLVACGFAQPLTGRGWSNFKGVIKTLTEAHITPDLYADYHRWVKAESANQGSWDVTLNSLAEKNRPERYMDQRSKKAIRDAQTTPQLSTTPQGSKNAYSKRNDPAYRTSMEKAE